jgi:transcription initiation factor TFIIB
MKRRETGDSDPSQTSIREPWQNRDPNPNASEEHVNPEPEKKETIDDFVDSDNRLTDTGLSQPGAIAQSPQSAVNTDGVVLPFTRQQLEPVENWDNSTTEPAEHDGPSISDDPDDTRPETPPTDSLEPTPSTQSVSNAGVKVVEREQETGQETEGETNQESIGAISSYANSSPESTKRQVKSKAERATGNTLIKTTCPECNGSIRIEHTDQYCVDCGLIVADEQIDPGPEWRAFNQHEKENKSRVGSPVRENIHDKGLSTVIGNGNTDAYGNPLSSSVSKRMSRLRKWNSRFMAKNPKERNLRQAFGEIQRISSEMDLPEYVEETACTVYRRAVNEGLLPGRAIEAVATASVYLAMRQAGIPKTADHLMKYSRVEAARVTSAYSYVGKELGIEIAPPDVTEYLSRVASELDVSKETERKAKSILQDSVDQNLHSGKDPSGMAAAAVYAATILTRCDRVTQEEASNAGDVCALTIRTRYRELLDAVGVDYEAITPPSPAEAEGSDD